MSLVLDRISQARLYDGEFRSWEVRIVCSEHRTDTTRKGESHFVVQRILLVGGDGVFATFARKLYFVSIFWISSYV